MILSDYKIKSFQDQVLQYYRDNKRDLPWRNTTDPYMIHVSEVMLQQTQAKRVIEYYRSFMLKYPTLQSLADSKFEDLVLSWKGLGFNSRVFRLRESARIILSKYNGEYPRNKKDLMQLPGIGEYTASAILAFAFNIDEPVIDVNIRRVLVYSFNLDKDISLKQLSEIASELIPKGKSREYHNALMDYGAMHLTSRKTNLTFSKKQKKFEGSDRQARAKVLSLLAVNKTLSRQKLQETFPDKDIHKIVLQMKKERLVNCEDDTVSITE